MRNKINCLIFDFDGVIADTDLRKFKTLKDILPNYDKELAKSFSKKDIIGLSTKGFLTKYSKTLTKNQIEEIVKKRHNLFFSNLSTYCLPFENMDKTIKSLGLKYDLVIVTTNTKENVSILLKHLNVINYFNWIIGREKSENNSLEKTYTLISEIINKSKDECIVIEDSNYGVNAAKKEGYFCIRFDPESIFDKGNENLKVKNFNELIEVIENTVGNNV